MSRRALVAAAAALLGLLGAEPAMAKELKYSTPGRAIYKRTETLGAVLDQNRRDFVIEVAFGNGPEGNLGVTLGWLINRPEGLELYTGFGTRLGPTLHHTASFRYFLPFLAYRAYVGSGYLFQRSPRIGVWSHSGFGETGYKWIIRHTYQVTLSVGMQRYLHRTVRPGSIFNSERVDRDRFRDELDRISANRYLLSLRFSRAF